MGFLLLGLGVAAGLGAAVALVGLLPPLRRWGRASLAGRAVEMITLGGLSLALAFAGVTYLLANALLVMPRIVFNTDYGPPPADWLARLDALRPAMALEFWLRFITPDAWRPACFSADPAVCQMAADVTRYFQRDWGDSGIALLRQIGTYWSLGLGAVAALASALTVWALTRRPNSGRRPQPDEPPLSD